MYRLTLIASSVHTSTLTLVPNAVQPPQLLSVCNEKARVKSTCEKLQRGKSYN